MGIFANDIQWHHEDSRHRQRGSGAHPGTVCAAQGGRVLEARSLQLLFHTCTRATLTVMRLSMTSQAQSYVIAGARALMALIFVLSGLSKISATDAMRGYMEAMGVPGIFLWPSILF